MISRDLEIAKLGGIEISAAFVPVAKNVVEQTWFTKVTHFFDYRLTLLAFDYRYGGLAVIAILGMIDGYLYILVVVYLIMYVAIFVARTLHSIVALNVWRRIRSATAVTAPCSCATG